MSTATTVLEGPEVLAPKRGRRWIDDWRPEDPVFWKTTGAAIARRNLIFSIFAEHIGFSVWTMWSVLVLFLGPQYGIDPAGKFLLTAAPGTARLRGAAAVHLRGGQVRRPQLDDCQRRPAAGAGRPGRHRDHARCLVHHA